MHMARSDPQESPNGWTILDRAARIWCYEYGFSRSGKANCFVAGLPAGKLLVLSPAHRLPAAAFADLKAIGEVAAVVASNGFHHLGVAAWRDRYPRARFFSPSLSRERIRKKNPGAGTLEPLSELLPLLGDGVVLREAPATRCGEMWAIARVDGGHAWFVSDVLANLPVLPSNLLLKLLFQWTRSAPGYRVFHLGLNFIVRDKKLVLRTLLDDLEAFPPSIVVPAHGSPLLHESVAAVTTTLVRAAL
jgi:hypothetical protein